MYPYAQAVTHQLVDAPTMPTATELAEARQLAPAATLPLFAAPAARRAHSLAQLLAEANAANPGRDKASDGWIGDAAHAGRDSQHNPDGWAVVTAQDIDTDGLNLAAAFERIRLRTAAGHLPAMVGGHLILNRRITTPDFRGWYAYVGSNPHLTHGHAACSRDRARYDDARRFGCFDLAAPLPPATGRDATGRGTGFRADLGDVGPRVAALQRWLNATFPAYSKLLPDGVYGPRTAAVIREFAHRCDITSADGLNVGPQIARRLARFGFR